MRIAIYNQMFGLDGRSFLSNLFGHWAVHFQSNPKKMWKRNRFRKNNKNSEKIKCRCYWNL